MGGFLIVFLKLVYKAVMYTMQEYGIYKMFPLCGQGLEIAGRPNPAVAGRTVKCFSSDLCF